MTDCLDNNPTNDARNQTRRPLSSKVEFIANFDILEAGGINISEGGIAFEVEDGLTFDMRLPDYSGSKVYRAELVWLKHKKEGPVRLGFKFISQEAEEF